MVGTVPLFSMSARRPQRNRELVASAVFGDLLLAFSTSR